MQCLHTGVGLGSALCMAAWLRPECCTAQAGSLLEHWAMIPQQLLAVQGLQIG